jgi:hypothetical protein
MQKISIGLCVHFEARPLKTQEKCLKWPKWSAARRFLGWRVPDLDENFRECPSG